MEALEEFLLQNTPESFMITFTRSTFDTEIAHRYGAPESDIETLSGEEADGLIGRSGPGSLLRVGSIPGWGFGYEPYGAQGWNEKILSTLSAETETVFFSTISGRTTVGRWMNSRMIEAFSMDGPQTLQHTGPAILFEQADMESSRSGKARGLSAVHRYVGASLSSEDLNTTLLTTWLPPVPLKSRKPSATPSQDLGPAI
jgi:hypothetical protein